MSAKAIHVLNSCLVKDNNDCFNNNRHITQHPAFLNIPQIQLHHLMEPDLIALRHLPQPGTLRRDGQALLVVLGVFGDFAHQRRAGADEGHVATEDVPELRQLIQAGFAQEVTDLGDARVVP